MKKYIKPSSEMVEATLSADCLGVSEIHDEVGGPQLSPGKKGNYISGDEDDNYGW